MIHFRIRYEKLRTRLESSRRSTAVVQALTLALIPFLVAALAWGLGHPGPHIALWPIVSVGTFAVSLAVLARPRSLSELGEMLDRRFGLDDLLVTALEVDRRGPASALEVHLLDDAASALARIERDPALETGDGADAATALGGVACLIAGAWLLAAALGVRAEYTRLPALPNLTVGLAASGHDLPGILLGPEATDESAQSRNGPPTPNAVAMRERYAPGASVGGATITPPTGQSGQLQPRATMIASGREGSGVTGRGATEPGDLAASAADGVVGGGGRAPGTASGGSLPWDHREAVRRYFADR